MNLPPSTTSRKRRLSDADVKTGPKRPRGQSLGPRLHAVSDPLPRTYLAVTEEPFWSNNTFELECGVYNDSDGFGPFHTAPLLYDDILLGGQSDVAVCVGQIEEIGEYSIFSLRPTFNGSFCSTGNPTL
jgi:hypothetical protein